MNKTELIGIWNEQKGKLKLKFSASLVFKFCMIQKYSKVFNIFPDFAVMEQILLSITGVVLKVLTEAEGERHGVQLY